MKGLARPYRARRSWDAYPDNVMASKPPNVNVASARKRLRVASSSALSQFALDELDELGRPERRLPKTDSSRRGGS